MNYIRKSSSVKFCQWCTEWGLRKRGNSEVLGFNDEISWAIWDCFLPFMYGVCMVLGDAIFRTIEQGERPCNCFYFPFMIGDARRRQESFSTKGERDEWSPKESNASILQKANKEKQQLLSTQYLGSNLWCCKYTLEVTLTIRSVTFTL